MSHSPNCTGCPLCNSVFAALVNASPREQVQFQQRKNQQEGLPVVAVAATTPAVLSTHEEPPSPPSLVDAIAGRTVPTAPVFGSGNRLTLNARPSDGVDDPPSLVDAIYQNRLTAAQRRRK